MRVSPKTSSMARGSRNASIPYRPYSRPTPEYLNPPQGACGSSVMPLITTRPARNCEATRRARWRSVPRTAAWRPYLRVVGDADRLLLGVVSDDTEHGAENLFPGDRHVVLHVDKHRGLHEVTRFKTFHLRYFVAIGEEQHYGRAAERLGIAQPALSRQIQDLEKELGFTPFDRLPGGVKLSAAGKLFLSDARRILQEVEEAKLRRAGGDWQGGYAASDLSKALSWHGVVPDSIRRFRRRQPDAELELHPMLSNQQMEAVRSGKLDAGFIFNLEVPDGDVAQLLVAQYKLMLAAPQGHALTRSKQVRLRDLDDAPFIWLHRWENSVYYDRIMHACLQGGMQSPRIVQHVIDHATTLSLVSCRLGVAFVSETARWNCPRGVTLLSIARPGLPTAVFPDLAEG